MLRLNVIGEEIYDEETEEFGTLPGFVLEIQHSLVSLSKWEAIYNKPFLSGDPKTHEETLAYVRCMIMNDHFDDDVIKKLGKETLDKIHAYVDSAQSATTFADFGKKGSRGRGETITSELIYYWMITFNIPFECETWHLNRLFALIRICSIKNSKGKTMSKAELAARNRALNAERKAKLGTSG